MAGWGGPCPFPHWEALYGHVAHTYLLCGLSLPLFHPCAPLSGFDFPFVGGCVMAFGFPVGMVVTKGGGSCLLKMIGRVNISFFYLFICIQRK